MKGKKRKKKEKGEERKRGSKERIGKRRRERKEKGKRDKKGGRVREGRGWEGGRVPPKDHTLQGLTITSRVCTQGSSEGNKDQILVNGTEAPKLKLAGLPPTLAEAAGPPLRVLPSG